MPRGRLSEADPRDDRAPTAWSEEQGQAVIALVTDSSSQLPEALRDRYHIRVVPIVVVVDGVEHEEGVDLDPDDFYTRLTAGATVSTAAPAPGRFLEAYRAAADAGATEVVSVHVGSNTSATIDAARIAAELSPVPVEIVDTGTASFPVACCVWMAARALEAGGDTLDAVRVAKRAAESVDNVFVVGALDLARRGGRLQSGAQQGDGLPVLALHDGTMNVVGRVDDLDAAVAAMATYVRDRAGITPQLVGVGHARAPELADSLVTALVAGDAPSVTDLVRYSVGPSVGVHTGAGTAGCVFLPALT
jgi:DegV family protein with EDD domain